MDGQIPVMWLSTTKPMEFGIRDRSLILPEGAAGSHQQNTIQKLMIPLLRKNKKSDDPLIPKEYLTTIESRNFQGGSQTLFKNKSGGAWVPTHRRPVSAKLRGCAPVSAKIRGLRAGGVPLNTSTYAYVTRGSCYYF